MEADPRNVVGKLLQALDHWRHVEEEWDADKNEIPLRAACAAHTCGVPHACPNEYDASREHVLAALDDPALAAWRGK